ncbi:hypothetical protein ACCS63_35995, partial [Rhizobium brockwellii]|uniref:hypothetical protein n=1 Tax=Rhizobium brockwellii TaxID=3019932 RepID=UPI003F99368D
MIDHWAFARDAKHLLNATGISGGKPVLLVGDENYRGITLKALSELTGVQPIIFNRRRTTFSSPASESRLRTTMASRRR